MEHPQFDAIIEEIWRIGNSENEHRGLWSNMRLARNKFKELHYFEFNNLQEELQDLQLALMINEADISLQQQEIEARSQLRKWLLIEESAVRQKDKVDSDG